MCVMHITSLLLSCFPNGVTLSLFLDAWTCCLPFTFNTPLPPLHSGCRGPPQLPPLHCLPPFPHSIPCAPAKPALLSSLFPSTSSVIVHTCHPGLPHQHAFPSPVIPTALCSPFRHPPPSPCGVPPHSLPPVLDCGNDPLICTYGVAQLQHALRVHLHVALQGHNVLWQYMRKPGRQWNRSPSQACVLCWLRCSGCQAASGVCCGESGNANSRAGYAPHSHVTWSWPCSATLQHDTFGTS